MCVNSYIEIIPESALLVFSSW